MEATKRDSSAEFMQWASKSGRKATRTMSRPPSTRVGLPADQYRAGHVGEGGHLAVAEGHIQVLAAAGPQATPEGGLDGIGAVEAGGEVGDGDADLDGLAAARARQVHEAELGLDHDVVAGARGAGARLAVARHRGVHEARVQGVQRGVVELVLGQRAGDEVLDQDVGLAGQAMQQGPAGGRLEVDAEGLFIAIDLEGA